MKTRRDFRDHSFRLLWFTYIQKWELHNLVHVFWLSNMLSFLYWKWEKNKMHNWPKSLIGNIHVFKRANKTGQVWVHGKRKYFWFIRHRLHEPHQLPCHFTFPENASTASVISLANSHSQPLWNILLQCWQNKIWIVLFTALNPNILKLIH